MENKNELFKIYANNKRKKLKTIKQLQLYIHGFFPIYMIQLVFCKIKK